jgi:hypothetical protein
MQTQLRPWYAPTTILFCAVGLACRDSLARSWSPRLAPWLLLLVLACFVPTQAAGQEIVNGADMHYARGIITLEKKLWDEAIAEFTKAIELDPHNPWTYHNRGKAYHNKNLYNLAIADYEKAIDKAMQLKPDFIPELYEDKNRAAKAKTEKKASDWYSQTFDRFSKLWGEGSNPQPTPESKQPWQTSWTAFCGELQRLYKSGATQEKLDALFGGKPVVWEGSVRRIDRARNEIIVDMPRCHVTRVDNHSAEVDPLILNFHSAAEIPSDLKRSAKVRFSTTIEPKIEPNMTVPAVLWFTVEEEGEFILVSTSTKTKLLEYSKVGDHPADKFIENYDRDPEGTSKKIDKFFEEYERKPQEQDKQVEDLMNELFK